MYFILRRIPFLGEFYYANYNYVIVLRSNFQDCTQFSVLFLNI